MRSQGYAFQVELTYRAVRAGFRVVEVPIVFRDREHGTSKMSLEDRAEAFWLRAAACASAASPSRPPRARAGADSGPAG